MLAAMEQIATIRRMVMLRPWWIAAIVAMLTFALNFEAQSAFAADLPVVSGHFQTQHRGGLASKADVDMRLEEFARGPHAACTAWTDGCRTCGRNPDGVSCSNVGIACLPSEPRCTRP
jgi:hypothetical protein